MQLLDWYIIILTLAVFYVRDASPQTRVSAGRDGQSDQVSPTHLNPLLGVSGADCGLQHDQQHHQPLSNRHSWICWCSSAGERKASLGCALGVWVEPVEVYIGSSCSVWSILESWRCGLLEIMDWALKKKTPSPALPNPTGHPGLKIGMCSCCR